MKQEPTLVSENPTYIKIPMAIKMLDPNTNNK